MSRFRQIFPDGTECGCLKTIVLFKPGIIYPKFKAIPYTQAHN